jgi:hypothetical protein
MSTIASHHERYVQRRHSSYEQLEIDILIDENFCVSLMEVNVPPSMSGADSKLDFDIKSLLMHDWLAMMRIIDCDCTVQDHCPGIDLVDHICSVCVNGQLQIRKNQALEQSSGYGHNNGSGSS